jgi:hypothetical protein
MQQLLTGTKYYQNNIRYLPESKGNCGSGGMLFSATRAQMAPPHRFRQASDSEAIWLHPEEYRGQSMLEMCQSLFEEASSFSFVQLTNVVPKAMSSDPCLCRLLSRHATRHCPNTQDNRSLPSLKRMPMTVLAIVAPQCHSYSAS